MSTSNTCVYLCSGCGIGNAVSMDGLKNVVESEFKKSCTIHDYLCGDEGLGLIRSDIVKGINQMVVAACSPRAMADRFRFNGVQVIRANLREQVVWSHPENEEDTQMMAEDNVRMAVTEAGKSTAPEPQLEGDNSEVIMVVGGGHSGLTAAYEAAKTGYDVLLVERATHLGGMARKWSKRMPTDPPYKNPQPNTVENLIESVSNDPRITVKMGCTVAKTSGMPGRFIVDFSDGSSQTVGAVVVATGWRPYDAGKLNHLGYGISSDVVTNVELEEMLTEGRIARPSDGKIPEVVVFVQCAGSRDRDHLPYCSSVCCGVSIKQALQLREAHPDVMIYIIYEELRTPGVAEEFYRTSQRAGVIFLKGKVQKIDSSLGITVQDAFLQQEVPLKGVEMVVLATGMVPNSTNIDKEAQFLDEEKLKLLNSDVNHYAPIKVAGAAAEPITLSAETLPAGESILNLQYRQGPHLPMLAHGFPDSHYICFPYETRRSGVYVAGPVRRPMDMGEAAEDATGAAMKAIQAIRAAARGIALHPRAGDLSIPHINLNPCTKCRRCTVECPFGAIDETEQGFPSVNATRCRRCGTCMGACPVRTISFTNYTVDMIGSMIKAVHIPDEMEEKPRILALVCENDAYPALDMVGIARLSFSAYVRIIPVRCLGSVNLLLVSDALSVGYDGVILMGCKPGDDYQCHFMKGSGIAQERLSKVSETLKSMALEAERVLMAEVSIADSAALPKVIQSFVKVLESVGPNPFKGF